MKERLDRFLPLCSRRPSNQKNSLKSYKSPPIGLFLKKLSISALSYNRIYVETTDLKSTKAISLNSANRQKNAEIEEGFQNLQSKKKSSLYIQLKNFRDPGVVIKTLEVSI